MLLHSKRPQVYSQFPPSSPQSDTFFQFHLSPSQAPFHPLLTSAPHLLKILPPSILLFPHEQQSLQSSPSKQHPAYHYRWPSCHPQVDARGCAGRRRCRSWRWLAIWGGQRSCLESRESRGGPSWLWCQPGETQGEEVCFCVG